MVAILVDYRVFGRHSTTPFEAIADAKSALRWVRAHATQLHVDPTRIVASGGSAGGHIALSVALFSRFDEAGSAISTIRPRCRFLKFDRTDSDNNTRLEHCRAAWIATFRTLLHPR